MFHSTSMMPLRAQGPWFTRASNKNNQLKASRTGAAELPSMEKHHDMRRSPAVHMATESMSVHGETSTVLGSSIPVEGLTPLSR